ncbi:MAG: FtsX-like permease family protein [Treponema sp.]|nr:FtsX-like permease family protein [Treponema sp.]
MDKLTLSWRQIRIHWGDSLLAVLGIALATAILAAVISLIGSYNSVFDRFTQQPQARQITVRGQFQAMGSGEAAVRIDAAASEPVRFNLQDVPKIMEDNPDVIASYQARYMRFTTTAMGGGGAFVFGGGTAGGSAASGSASQRTVPQAAAGGTSGGSQAAAGGTSGGPQAAAGGAGQGTAAGSAGAGAGLAATPIPGGGSGPGEGFGPPEMMGFGTEGTTQVVDTPLLEQVQGYMASASFFTAYELQAKEGILFDDRDVTQGNAVAVVGSELAKKLYSDQRILNKKIRLNGRIYTIIGVLAPYAYSTEGLPVSFDELIFVPTREGIARSGASGGANATFFGRVGELSFTAKKGADLAKVAQGLEASFARLYGENKAVAQTQISQVKKDLDKRLKILSLLALLASAVGVAAAINIFNLMIGRVSRRTRSIAIQRSLGATSRSMLIQTLMETFILAAIGAFIGFVLSFPLERALQSILEKSQLRGMVLPQRFDLALGVSLLAILVAGLFAVPAALAAANTDIVDALREE